MCYWFVIIFSSNYCWLIVIVCDFIGSIPEIDELFPPRPPPIKRLSQDELQIRPIPAATGAAFFTPETGNAGNLFRGWKPEPSAPQAFRIAPPAGPRDSM